MRVKIPAHPPPPNIPPSPLPTLMLPGNKSDTTWRPNYSGGMIQRKFFTAEIFFLLSACLLECGIASGRAQSPVEVVIDPQRAGAEIAPDYLGLSFEMQSVLAGTNGTHFFSASNRPLIATFKTLGIKNLRVGGNTADRPALPVPNETDVDNLFAFAKAAGVKVIYTLRLNHGDPGDDAKIADYISRRYKNQLDCFAIGNEPNVFSTNYEAYIAGWKRYAAQITAPTNLPNAKFSGPGVSPGHETWSARFANDPAAAGKIKFISQHDYPGGDARKAADAAAARDKILSPAMDEHYAKFANNFVPTVISNGLAFRFEEANSFYDGGAADASDTFAAALWALDYQWWWAAHGMNGINFHTGDKVAARDENKPCRYATFWTSTNGYNVHPIGYAEKMFSLGSRGKMIPAKILAAQTNLNFAAYAVLGGGKNIYVTLINKSHDATATNLSVQISAQQINGFAKGEIIRLTAPDGDVSRKTGVTLGGAEITDDAKWKGRWEKIPATPGKSQSPLIVELPAASAALVKLTP
jgi:hypothetical protein